ncbi:transposase [Novosphingobium profundi]|nr:transposase [Novosphingobium profundi]
MKFGGYADSGPCISKGWRARQRHELTDRKWRSSSPLLPNRSSRKKRVGFAPWHYKQRNLVERFFNRTKPFQGIATRYDTCAENDLAVIKLVCPISLVRPSISRCPRAARREGARTGSIWPFGPSGGGVGLQMSKSNHSPHGIRIDQAKR